MSELKPCPFCGCKATLISHEKYSTKHWAAQCETCGARGGLVSECDTKLKDGKWVSISEVDMILKAWEGAIKAWNRRVKDE